MIAETLHSYAVTSSEAELVELIRGADLDHFTLAVEVLAGVFRVRVTDTLRGKFLQGEGLTFEDAWRRLRSLADGQRLALEEQIAARGLSVEMPR